MPVKFPALPIQHFIQKFPEMAAKLTRADNKVNGGNGDSLVQWEEAAAALDNTEIRSYVKLSMEFMQLPIGSVVQKNPELAAKLTRFDNARGNGDGQIQWEEAVAALDDAEFDSYVKLAMESNSVLPVGAKQAEDKPIAATQEETKPVEAKPDPCLAKAAGIYRSQAEFVIKSLRDYARYAIQAADYEFDPEPFTTTINDGPNESWRPPYDDAKKLATRIKAASPADHPVNLKASDIVDFIDNNDPYDKHAVSAQYSSMTRYYRNVADMLELLGDLLCS
jgi:hypothetical protein